ncbi:MAG: mandelate racemase/muconate lactonizing enzyme family protein [Chloroflexota bacterium]|nr:mandelate racemase/muconate lactonizing enzyme family protein [Chloroflexota bacterium]
MRINDIRVTLLQSDGPVWMDAVSILGQGLRASVLVQVDTDAGLTGIAEADWLGNAAVVATIVDTDLKPMLVGQDPAYIERLYDMMYRRLFQKARRGPVMAAISGVDIALWDLLGKATGRPVFQLLGGYRDRIRTYASGGFYAEGKTTDDLAREMAGYVERGFGAVKMKIGRLPHDLLAGAGICRTGLAEDLDRVRAVRAAIGPDRLLMVDVNRCWDVPTALKMGRKLEELDVHFLEEPITTDDVDGSAALAAALDLPIAGYESELSLTGFRQLIDRRAVDVVQPDVIRTGGFTGTRKIAAYAAAHHLPVTPHAFASALSTVANLHLLGGIENGGLLEYCQYPSPLMTDLLLGMPQVGRDGTVSLPVKPGLGVELNPAVIERYRL